MTKKSIKLIRSKEEALAALSEWAGLPVSKVELVRHDVTVTFPDGITVNTTVTRFLGGGPGLGFIFTGHTKKVTSPLPYGEWLSIAIPIVWFAEESE